ncbi:CHAP domain-containing protein [Fusobacterium necrophorum]|uniref:CHAP domain-containing protein n=2 Tax=Fusobacterium necrophorum TaxID=859 RepID=A0AAW6W8B1_9FUSO|nr:CHAP domain-containing protein [Fusobacterium necrophorum]AYV95657.1 CHAP domain-containing protein [Fusobacterium necrophorum subsp. funduliforme]KYL00547.1 conjugal transfer protein [Fusobacterium necrophorum subsp. funduliforme]KYM39194.1 conjugal transfer protein [Fusobacterium necrophorum subsp. funduliforme]KYM48784.1 conjugal transfer protein [Fusobacterium necrophorum subsp. funduliforme]KYM52664.1 conjugal transfer protein [Fusobacterium necrophorum subsp. funduliforme]
MKEPLEPRDKFRQKMNRDGLIRENMTTGETENISSRVNENSVQDVPESLIQGKEISNKKSSRLTFTEEERNIPELQKYIKKSDQAADRLDEAMDKIPKKKTLSFDREFDERSGKGKTRLHFEEKEKPIGTGKERNPLSPALNEAGAFVHKKIHEAEHDNAGVEAAHKTEKAAETLGRYSVRKARENYRSHKLKPYRKARKAEKAAEKANAKYFYKKAMYENPNLSSANPFSRMWQKRRLKRKYAAELRKKGQKAAKAAKKSAKKTKQAGSFIIRHRRGIAILIALSLIFILIFTGLSSCSSLLSGGLNGILGTSYTSEDSDLVAVENAYAAMENELQGKIDNVERDHPGYDEYKYELDGIGHNPHELASILTAKHQSYTLSKVQADLQKIFTKQYSLTLKEEIEVRYKTETHTDPDTGETTEEEVPYNYYILHVRLKTTPLSDIAREILNEEQLKMYRVYLETSGNKPLVFGGGSPDGSASEDLSGVHFVNGTRPGNPELVNLAKKQVGNVGGYPYWSWYGFNGRVEWCACFVSWCYNKAGKSEPRFAGCQSQGVPWFTSRGQWGARGYKNIAPGDAIFFDWDGDGGADHVGIVIGTDGSRVYTVEGNSGDACKIKSYDLNSGYIKGYGLMNWD